MRRTTPFVWRRPPYRQIFTGGKPTKQAAACHRRRAQPVALLRAPYTAGSLAAGVPRYRSGSPRLARDEKPFVR